MRRLATVVLIALGAVIAGVVPAQGVVEHSLRVEVNADFAPHALPRKRLAPIEVQLGGSISTTDGSRQPALRELSIAMNRAGRISSVGLPTCSPRRLQQTTTEAALAACPGALVGHGSFAANVDFEGAPAIPAQGKVLVFNARIDGRPGMLLHLYGSQPVRAAFVLPFTVSHKRHGRFGTVFLARIPRLASGIGYITKLQLKIGRRYGFKGERRDFLSARCNLPSGFTELSFVLAKMTFAFEDGRRVIARPERICRVRR
ncbi:MAG: hypothetical protein ACM3N0_08900 [Chloroflexota bacterium]